MRNEPSSVKGIVVAAITVFSTGLASLPLAHAGVAKAFLKLVSVITLSIAACVVGILGVVGASQPSMAVTLTIDGSGTPYQENGFQIDPIRIVSGNCDGVSGKPCMAFNTNDTSTLTMIGGGAFTLNDFGFEFQGNPSTLEVTAYSGATLVDTVDITDVKNTWLYFSSYSGPIANITSIVFADTGEGNIRIDDINVTAAPLPGALYLFATGLGLFGLLGRRRKGKMVTAALS